MSLILKVTSPQHKLLGVDSAKSFNQQGGSIGRSQENDWVLPDPDRFVSSRHIAIDYRDGGYFLRDTSANGVYINDWEHPIDRDQPAELKSGDIIAIGNYEIEVSLAEPVPSQLTETDPLAMLGGLASVPPDPFAQKEQSQPPLVPEPPPTSPTPRQVIHPGVGAHGAREHISEVLDPLELMDAPGPHTSQKMDTGPIGDDFWDTEMDRGLASEPDNLAATNQFFSAPNPEAAQIPDDWDSNLLPGTSAGEAAHGGYQENGSPQSPSPTRGQYPPQSAGRSPSSRQGRVAPRRPAQPRQPPRRARNAPVPGPSAAAEPRERAPDLQLLHSFLNGAGMEALDLSSEDATQLMRLMGAIFRQVVQDVREVLLARANLKAGFRMELTTIKPLENNPLKFSVGGVDDTLQNLLLKKGSGYLPPQDAFREGFQDIKDHQVAMMAGMRAAFGDLLKRFEPKLIESRSGKSGGMFRNKKTDYWDAHNRIYQEVLREAEDDFQFLFGKEFAEAYEKQIQILSQARGQSTI